MYMGWRGIGWWGSIIAGGVLLAELNSHPAASRIAGWAILGVAVALALWLALALLLARRDRELDILSRLQFLCPIRREWILEVGGLPVAQIRNPVFTDMFWSRYQVVPLVQDPGEVARLFQID